MGGRGGSSGFSGRDSGSIYKQLDIPKNDLQGKKFDAGKFEGTERQKQYAQDIIDKGYSYIDNQLKNEIQSLENYYKDSKSMNSAYAYMVLADGAASAKALVETKKKLDSMLERTKNAASIIKNKNLIQNALPSVQKELKDKYRKEYEEKYKKKFKK